MDGAYPSDLPPCSTSPGARAGKAEMSKEYKELIVGLDIGTAKVTRGRRGEAGRAHGGRRLGVRSPAAPSGRRSNIEATVDAISGSSRRSS